ncbi:chain length regulator (capsular polysaccharide biosynthesis) [Photobacterium sp. SKA34]|uniref:polysaccharide biosynthesis tyrosine autokinase n=1 Tax=Photobacterium sp. SKA34 TaxID=121723 RepID=UPI00006ACD11|nr:polysaccharide biosynthesis tyrosine autokinase [Photobacterium sp. SKA34]EAR56452.1 chain length regulator (capsular polysaccharide biosynthesis) [Photobacterium sp. SKA34]
MDGNSNLNLDDINLMDLFKSLLESWKLILSITCFFMILGVLYVKSTPLTYQAETRLQVETQHQHLDFHVNDISNLFISQSTAKTEIEIIKSRMVLGRTVDNLNLTLYSSPIFTPIIGKKIAYFLGNVPEIKVSLLITPENDNKSSGNSEGNYIVKISDDKKGLYDFLNEDNKLIFSGEVGKLENKNGYEILISKLDGKSGQKFIIKKLNRYNTISSLRSRLSIMEPGKDTGILYLSLKGNNPLRMEAILNDIVNNELTQNIDHNALEAAKSLVFIENQLPEVKRELDIAENKLNTFKVSSDSVDMDYQAKSTLNILASVESKLIDLGFKESELSKLYTKEHPAYVALLQQKRSLLKRKVELENEVSTMPKTNQRIITLNRDVMAAQHIYMSLINKVQQLRISQASTVGSVRLIDSAEASPIPIKPKKALIVVLATLFGGMLSIVIVLLKKNFISGIDDPRQISSLGLPLYATVPYSDNQSKLLKKNKNSSEFNKKGMLLACLYPNDLAIEAIKLLRTSLYFSMSTAGNNILMISGSSPELGKSFLSANLAIVFSQAKKKVLFIDTDMRRGKSAKIFDLKCESGLSEYLSYQLDLDETVQNSNIDNLDVISCGSTPPNPSELLMGNRLSDLMQWANENYDIIIVDTPSLLAVTDAALVGKYAGTNFLVGRFKKTSVHEIEVAKERFNHAGVGINGFIFNSVEKKISNTYGYYNYSYADK